MATRKRTIELTLRLTVDEYYTDDTADEESKKFYWEENHCVLNELDKLAEALEKVEEGICDICCHAEVKMLPLGSPEGYNLSDEH